MRLDSFSFFRQLTGVHKVLGANNDRRNRATKISLDGSGSDARYTGQNAFGVLGGL